MSKVLEKIKNAIEPYFALLTMIIFFAGLFISAYRFIISPSDLSITVETERLNYPSSIGNAYSNIYKLILSKDTLIQDAATVYSFLVRTTESKKIILKNTSSNTLRGVKFKHLNTDVLTAWGITSDFLTSTEEQKLKENLVFDESKQITYLLNPIDIAPNSQVIITIWGSFKSDIFDKDIIATHEGGEGYIEKSYLISGLKGYFVNFAFEFIAIMLFIFVGVYYIGIKFAREKP